VGLSSGLVPWRLRVPGHRLAVGRWPLPCRGFPRPAPMRSSFRRSHSPSSRRLPFEGRPVCSLPSSWAGSHRPRPWAPLMEFLKDRPSTGCTVRVHSRFPEVRGCHTRTRSALVVPPDLGGFLRARLCGFVAPRSRSWGSPGFVPTAGSRRHPTLLRASLSPSKFLPPGQPGACHQAPCLLAVAVTQNRSPAKWNQGPTLGLEAFLRPGVSHASSRTPALSGGASCCHDRYRELPWGSLDPGSHPSAVPFPGTARHSDPCGSSLRTRSRELLARRFPSGPGGSLDPPSHTRRGLSSARRPPCSARAPSRPYPRRYDPWHPRRGPDFSRSPAAQHRTTPFGSPTRPAEASRTKDQGPPRRMGRVSSAPKGHPWRHRHSEEHRLPRGHHRPGSSEHRHSRRSGAGSLHDPCGSPRARRGKSRGLARSKITRA